MRKITVILILLTGLVSTVSAENQLIAKGAPIALTMPGERYMAPKWSPDGNQLAVTGPSYVGIYLLDFPGGEITVLNEEPSAGFGMAWSPDGQGIVARVARYADKRRYNQVVLFTLEGERRELSEEVTILPGIPRFSGNGDFVFLEASNGFRSYASDPAIEPVHDGLLTYIRNDGLFLRDMALRSETRISSETERVVSVQVSPDGSRLVYATVGQHLWIANSDGSDRRPLADGTIPVWTPDGEWIIYMLTVDDGHQILNSDIYAIQPDGRTPVNLTNTTNRIEMNPDVSPDGNWVAFDMLNMGQIFVQQIEGR